MDMINIKKSILIIIFIAFAATGSLYFIGQKIFFKQGPEKTFAPKEACRIAFKWMKNQCPTYVYDGEDLKLKETQKLDIDNCKDCYEFVFSFISRHGGYGNRKGEMVTQVITPHLTTVTVDQRKVIQAITDNRFNELTGQIKQDTQEKDKLKPRIVKVFFYNKKLDVDAQGQIQCSSEAVKGVERIIPGQKPIQETLAILLKGDIRDQEKEAGFQTEFPHPDFILKSLHLDQNTGLLTLAFSKVPGFTSGGSCRIRLLKAQIEKTAKQFPGVRKVDIEPETLFQP